MVKASLAAICSLTLLATGYLSLSLLVLRPPRANYPEWFMMAALFVTQSAFTLLAVAGMVSGGWVRGLLLTGSLAIVWVGASWARATLTSDHFEGYALVLGLALVIQGALTFIIVLRQRPFGLFTAPQR